MPIFPPRPTLTDDELLARFKKQWPRIWRRSERKGTAAADRRVLLLMAREDYQRGILG